MNIVVLLKQVPATESHIGISENGRSVQTDNVKWVINPYDELAVEEALRIREDKGGTVTIISIGPDRAAESIRTALAMGADKGILINDPVAETCDGLGIARILATVLSAVAFDLIIAGQRSVDDENYMTGPAVAELLDIPSLSQVFQQETSGTSIRCHCSVDGGSVVMEAPLPALITTQRGLNEPRYASLPGIMKAKRKPIDVKSLADIGLDAESLGASRCPVTAFNFPPERSACKMLQADTPQATAAELVQALQNDAKVL